MISYIIDENILLVNTSASNSVVVKNTTETVEFLNTTIKELENATTPEEYKSIMESAEDLLKEQQVKDDKKTIEGATNDLLYMKDGRYYLQLDSKLKSRIPLPELLVEKIQWAMDTGNDPMPFVKMWVMWLSNDNYSVEKTEKFMNFVFMENIDFELLEKNKELGYSHSLALKLSKYNDVQITKSGILLTKKYVRLADSNSYYIEDNVVYCRDTNEPAILEDVDFLAPVYTYSGDQFLIDGEIVGEGREEGHLIRVGSRITLPRWDMVDTRDERFGCKGLHVGGHNYVRGFGGKTDMLIDCFVSPDMIGAISDQSDSGDGALRVKEYFVYGANQGRTKGIYHSGDYAEFRESEWKRKIEEAIKRTEAQLDVLKAELI